MDTPQRRDTSIADLAGLLVVLILLLLSLGVVWLVTP
jgi:hypothetical protein